MWHLRLQTKRIDYQLSKKNGIFDFAGYVQIVVKYKD